ncbi:MULTISPECIES: hypothetical protein [unclassified Lysobacter]|uniref:hypothetical protein n=1 Tax=unclassified Lysobacter TaxID=2635362 RepID=UPI001BE4F9E7|nr:MULTISPECIES: hypothetical protein [unclassified Lysobacter]MBT2750162.1 hypothetical protein [Lysobacter sp. ISL-50]MBT2775267.1 hypothetical protein [Lysobacter sp. ISL-54]MBT2782640.1 hypothetical protein [Lysobacter sp. ISL-52]
MDSASVGKHPCPECGGDLQWNAAKQSLACPYCGTIVPWSPAQEAQGEQVAELDLVKALAEHPADQRGYGDDAQRREVQCRSCKAISVFVDGKVADRCEFCGSPSIIDHQSLGDAVTPQSLLPFKISDGQVRDSIRKWYGTRWFAPNRLKSAALTDTLKGIYLPYWTFDAHVAASWTAEAGYHYYESESYSENGERKTRQVQRTRWEDASGSLQHFFDDELVPGTVGVHQDLLRQIGTFPTTTDLKAYSPEFVRGWLVERYQVDLRQAAQRGEASMQEQTRALCSADVPGDTQRNLQVQASFRGRTFKHILVPVWLVSYTYGSRSFQVLANGYTGQIAGERPYSWVKIFFASLAALIVAMVLLVVFGGNR